MRAPEPPLFPWEIACKQCKAEPGEPCKTKDGKKISPVYRDHRIRVHEANTHNMVNETERESA